MKYLRKHKVMNKFKILDSISEFKDNFETYYLYELKEITKEEYGKYQKQKQIEEHLEQLKALGVDVNSLGKKEQTNESEPTTEIPGTQEDVPLQGDEYLASSSKVKNPQTGKTFTIGEIKAAFFTFKDQLEKDIPEIAYSSFDESGITLSVTEARRDIPPRLPNGIPLKQVLI